MRALALILFLSVILGQDEDIDLDTVNLDLDALWENTVWEEIQDVTDVYYEVEQVTPVAGQIFQVQMVVMNAWKKPPLFLQ